MNGGAISNVLNWLTEPVSEQHTVQGWLIGLVVILVLAFLWSRVIKQMMEI